MTSHNTPKLKIVPDTNFYIAAALKDGYSRNYLVGTGSIFLKYQLFISPAILQEVQNKLETKFGLERAQVAEAIELIGRVTKPVYPKRKLDIVRDPSDNIILECALEVEADLILSLDKDLLSLKRFETIQVVHPRMLKHWF